MEDEELYWVIVKACLVQLFEIDEEQADKLCDQQRQQLANSTKDSRKLFYHAEMLDVAADLAGADEVHGLEILNKYTDILADHGW